ncbi:MAG: E3 ubiquitin ligase family protein [Synechococcales cyanobacterium T60_A2020_003]|nr:E3 ubiquitin ligase family protein [Synechococcales cyanobacterium T60_A2020_003]
MTFLIVLGIIFLIIAIILFFNERHQRGTVASLRTAKSATVAELNQLAEAVSQDIGGGSWRDYVKVLGTIECDRPLQSELSATDCVYYTMSVTREYEETVTRTDSEGKRTTETQHGSQVMSSNKRSVPFLLNDGTGTIEVSVDGATIDTETVLDEFRQESDRGGLISYGSFSLAVNAPSAGRRTLGYRYNESVLPIGRRVLVVGMVSDQPGTLVLQKPTNPDHRFIVSFKTDDTLTTESDRAAKNTSLWMKICLVVGAVLILIGMLF